LTRKEIATVVEAIRSPFAGHKEGAFPTAAGHLGVTLSATLLPGTALVSTWISGIEELTNALQGAWATVPASTGQSGDTAHGLVIRTGPEEFMVVPNDGAPVAQALRAIVTAGIGSVTDLSHARCRIRIEGAQSKATLSKLFALDLREGSFLVGEARLTGTHHVPCVLHRRSADRFDLLVFSTYAYDQLSMIMDAALEYGVTVTVP
jgi:heterotetrameric sarcosine oxidase gamma subunit